MKLCSNESGFTLIEVPIVIAIIIILSGISLSSYYRFTQRQEALNDARNFATMLRRVQAYAKNLVYFDNCSGLMGYQLTPTCTGVECQTVDAKPVCNLGGQSNIITAEKVLTKAYFGDNFNITFMAGSGKILINGDEVVESVDFPLTYSNNPFRVVVTLDNNGVISTKEYEN